MLPQSSDCGDLLAQSQNSLDTFIDQCDCFAGSAPSRNDVGFCIMKRVVFASVAVSDRSNLFPEGMYLIRSYRQLKAPSSRGPQRTASSSPLGQKKNPERPKNRPFRFLTSNSRSYLSYMRFTPLFGRFFVPLFFPVFHPGTAGLPGKSVF